MKMHCVYRFINEDNEIIYIGRTSQGMDKRMGQHFSSNGHLAIDGYRAVERIEYAELPTKADVDVVEKYLVSTLRPVYNKEFMNSGQMTVEVKVNLNWTSYPYIKKQNLRRNPQEINRDLRSEIEKLRIERNNFKERSDILKKEMDILVKKNEVMLNNLSKPKKEINREPESKTLFYLSPWDIEKLFESDRFEDMAFIGEVMINGVVKESITIKKENDVVVASFVKKDCCVPFREAYLNIDYSIDIGLINIIGFKCLSSESRAMEAKEAYLKIRRGEKLAS